MQKNRKYGRISSKGKRKLGKISFNRGSYGCDLHVYLIRFPGLSTNAPLTVGVVMPNTCDSRLSEVLQREINEYLKIEGNTQESLAMKVGVRRGTIHRVLEGRTPSLEKALILVPFFIPQESRLELMAEAYPSVASFLNTVYSDGHIVQSSDELNNLFVKHKSFIRIHSYACMKGGVSREEIISKLGVVVLPFLEELVSKGHLVLNEETKCYEGKNKPEFFSCTNVEALFAKITTNSDHFDIEALSEDQIGAAMNFLHKTSVEGVRFLRNLAFFNLTILATASKQEWFQGDIAVFMSGLTGPLDKVEAAKVDREEYKATKDTVNSKLNDLVKGFKIK